MTWKSAQAAHAAVALNAAAWAAFLLRLARDGHEPSGPLLLPIARADYYQWEALLVLPTHGLMFLVFSGVLFVGAGKSSDWGNAQGVAGWAMAISSGAVWLVPDIVVYVVGGFEALGPAMKYYVPLSAIAGIGLATSGLIRVHGLKMGRAVLIALVGWGAHMMVGAPVLR